ncbi:SEL1-like repeat protein [Pseudoalteromonas sp. R3]|uniref:tetratricopeptide repeat protein n=1 Tax=Pseudoalteromonas sp. R3 TaxID=1709477 RepID=UPI0006B5A5F6|nr:SEL1-like repeat protein [Pseudoalteromonas sp. R3]AZZ98644.1 sel1 repeat family protein [Pseudoalteromonas sp. R3]
MKKNQLAVANGNDLEQQLLNVLEFVTATPDSENRWPSDTDSKAAYKKGLYYLKNKQYPLAAKWLRLAAMSGDNKAQFYLGMLFIKGQGVPKSVFHGIAWLSLAQSQGNQAAAGTLEQVRTHLTAKRFIDAQCYAATLYEQIHQMMHFNQDTTPQ